MDAVSTFWESSPLTWTRDLREPMYTFDFNGEEWGFFLADFVAWGQMLFLVSLQSFFTAITAAMVYKLIVQRQGTTLSYLVCYGFVLPSLFLVPTGIFYFLGVYNQYFRYALGAIIPVTCMFKTTAAAHGFLPKYTTTTMKEFCFYYTVTLPMVRDEKLDKWAPSTWEDIIYHLIGFVKMMPVVGLMRTLFEFLPFVPPFATGAPAPGFYSVERMFDPATMMCNLMMTAFLCGMLTLMAHGLLAGQMLVTGVKAQSAMDNPLLTSRSYTQFWGARWNKVAHDGLKMGVYLPVRKHFSREVAMLAAFVASGLFHELLLKVSMEPLDDSNGCWSDPNSTKVDCYRPAPFVTTIFFLWQAAAVALEYSGAFKKDTLWDTIPTPIASMGIILSASPIVHFFMQPYWNSLCFANGMVLFSFVKPLTAP